MADGSEEPTAPRGAREDPSALLSALTDELDYSYKVAERLDAKTGRSATFAAAFFALVQAAAISGLLKSLLPTERLVLLILALVALASLALAGLALLRQERLIRVGDLPVDRIEKLVDRTFDPELTTTADEVNLELAKIYSSMVRSRRDANEKRRYHYRRARLGFGVALLLTSTELGWALFSRIPGVNI